MRRAIAIGAGLSALVALPACGGGGEQPVATAVLDEPQASEAVTMAAVAIADALVALAAAPLAADQLATASAAGGCARGTLTGTCVLRHSGSTLRATARHCQLVDPASGQRITVDGRLTVTTPFAVCGSGGLIPVNGVRTYRFDGFGAVVDDGAGVVEAFAAERFVETVQPLRSGCDLGDATMDLDGALSLQQRGGIDAALRVSDLHLERRTTGTAGSCTRTIEARGALAVDDHAGARRAAADLDGLTVAIDAAGALRRIDGGLALACAAPLTIVTDVPLVPGDRCPRAGMLELERRDGSRGFVAFGDSGVRIDADADGVADRVAPDCRDPDLAQCP